jgi:hypothetical protein
MYPEPTKEQIIQLDTDLAALACILFDYFMEMRKFVEILLIRIQKIISRTAEFGSSHIGGCG